MNKNGRIEVICGCMFSGKTEELIRRVRRAQIAKMSVIVFKPKIDSRFSNTQIVSHNKIKIDSHCISSPNDILDYSTEYDVFGIDETQFFDKDIINVCKKLATIGKRVIIAGLDKDYKSNPFGFMPHLMCEADYLVKLRAICIKCSGSASYTKRTTKEIDQVVIGELDKYQALCRNCYNNL